MILIVEGRLRIGGDSLTFQRNGAGEDDFSYLGISEFDE